MQLTVCIEPPERCWATALAMAGFSATHKTRGTGMVRKREEAETRKTRNRNWREMPVVALWPQTSRPGRDGPSFPPDRVSVGLPLFCCDKNILDFPSSFFNLLPLLPPQPVCSLRPPLIMALPLPAIESVKDCASFSHTVLPFLSQLTALPERLQLAATAKDPVILKDIYLSTNPFVSALGFSLLISVFFLVFSEITRNHSQVDRCWPFLPGLYNVHFAVWARMSGLRTQSLDTIAILSLLWAVSHRPHMLCIATYS